MKYPKINRYFKKRDHFSFNLDPNFICNVFFTPYGWIVKDKLENKMYLASVFVVSLNVKMPPAQTVVDRAR